MKTSAWETECVEAYISCKTADEDMLHAAHMQEDRRHMRGNVTTNSCYDKRSEPYFIAMIVGDNFRGYVLIGQRAKEQFMGKF
jgi:hypothetical protein